MKHRIASLFLTLVLCMGLAAPVWAASTVTVKVDLEVDYSAAYEALEELNALRREAGIGELVMDAAMMEWLCSVRPNVPYPLAIPGRTGGILTLHGRPAPLMKSRTWRRISCVTPAATLPRRP